MDDESLQMRPLMENKRIRWRQPENNQRTQPSSNRVNTINNEESESSVPVETGKATEGKVSVNVTEVPTTTSNYRFIWSIFGFLALPIVTVLFFVFLNHSHYSSVQYVVCRNDSAICRRNNLTYPCDSSLIPPVFPCYYIDTCDPRENDCNSPFGNCTFNATSKSYQCICEDGYVLDPNGKNCHSIASSSSAAPQIASSSSPVNLSSSQIASSSSQFASSSSQIASSSSQFASSSSQFVSSSSQFVSSSSTGSQVVCPGNFCLNGGTCIIVGNNATCFCPPSTGGVRCENLFCLTAGQFFGNQTIVTYPQGSVFDKFAVGGTAGIVLRSSSSFIFVYATLQQILFSSFDTGRLIQCIGYRNDTTLFIGFDAETATDIALSVFTVFGSQIQSLNFSKLQDCGVVLDEFSFNIPIMNMCSVMNSTTIIVYVSTNFGDNYIVYLSNDFSQCSSKFWFTGSSLSDTVYDPVFNRIYGIIGSVVYADQSNIQAGTTTPFFTSSDTKLALVSDTLVNTVSYKMSGVINGTVFITVNALNWTFNFFMFVDHSDTIPICYVLDSNANILSYTTARLPLPFVDARFISTPWSDLYIITDGTLTGKQTCLGTNLTISDCSQNCGFSGVCQLGQCQCNIPAYTGIFPACTQNNYCSFSLDYVICQNVPGLYVLVTFGAQLTSWRQIQSVQRTSPSIVNYAYSGAYFSALNSSVFVAAGFDRAFSSPNIILQTTSTLFFGRDDRDFVTIANILPQDASLCTFSYMGFHATNSSMIYFSGTDPALTLYDFVSNITVNLITRSQLIAVSCLQGDSSALIVYFATDNQNTIWVIATTSLRTFLLRYRADLNLLLSCEILNGLSNTCQAALKKGTCTTLNVQYNCGGLFSSSLYFSATLSSTVFNYTVNTTVPASSKVNGTVLSSGIFTSNSFGTSNTVSSLSSTNNPNTLFQLYSSTNMFGVSVSPTSVLQSTQTIGGSSFVAAATIASDYSNHFAVSSIPAMNPNNGFFERTTNVAQQYFTVNGSNPCLTANGGCGSRYCIPTISQNTRCDFCGVLRYARNLTWNASFTQPQFLYSDPFETKQWNPKVIFVAANNNFSTIYRYNVDNNTFLNPVTVLPFQSVMHSFSMSIDTHEYLIYAAVYNITANSTVACAVDYTTNTLMYSLPVASLNLTAGRTYHTLGFFVNYVRRVFLIVWDDSSNILIAFKFTSNFTFISQFSPSNPTALNSLLPYKFAYDTNLYFVALTSSWVSSYLGGVGYSETYKNRVLQPLDPSNNVLTGTLSFSLSNLYAFDVTANSMVIAITLQTLGGSTYWAAVYGIAAFAPSLTFTPLRFQNHNSVSNSAYPLSTHASAWGTLYTVFSDGSVIQNPCFS